MDLPSSYLEAPEGHGWRLTQRGEATKLPLRPDSKGGLVSCLLKEMLRFLSTNIFKVPGLLVGNTLSSLEEVEVQWIRRVSFNQPNNISLQKMCFEKFANWKVLCGCALTVTVTSTASQQQQKQHDNNQ